MATGLSREKLPLIVIVGPTASGKTSLAVELAERYGGEIICADSRTVYKDMDIGTAKPTAEEQAKISHWGLDLIAPGERFTVADFKRYADQKIDEIRGRGHTPFLVGGTGLYVDAVVFDYQFGGEVDRNFREKLMSWTLEELYKYCEKNNIKLPENFRNKRYVVRAIEQKSVTTTRKDVSDDRTIIVGITTEKEVLRRRIDRRTEQLFENDVVEEATMLGKKYGWDSEAMTGNIYPLVRLYLKNELTLEEIKEKNTTSDWQLAKRQLTWLKRNPHIKWLDLAAAKKHLSTLLAKS